MTGPRVGVIGTGGLSSGVKDGGGVPVGVGGIVGGASVTNPAGGRVVGRRGVGTNVAFGSPVAVG
jgi:hypothetical protein